jgi:peptidoglycan/xylan/chitin deacetylase (PgdA/CDA1 family)
VRTAGQRPDMDRRRAALIATVRRIRRHHTVILGYHGVGTCPRKDDPHMLQLAPARFREQVEIMLEAGFQFVTVAELARRAERGWTGAGLAAVTFDDGMRNNVTTAWPILADLGIVAAVYVTSGWLGGRSPWIGAGGDGEMLREHDVRQLAAAGWEIGAHTVTHADLSALDYDGCRREVETSCEALTGIAGRPVETFAYPWGRYNQAAIRAVRNAGLRAAVATASGSRDPYQLTRAMIGSADPFPVVLLKMIGRCDSVLRSTPLRLARRASDRVQNA